MKKSKSFYSRFTVECWYDWDGDNVFSLDHPPSYTNLKNYDPGDPLTEERCQEIFNHCWDVAMFTPEGMVKWEADELVEHEVDWVWKLELDGIGRTYGLDGKPNSEGAKP